MERKLATVVFVDIVESSALVAGADPEVVRRRVDRFFDQASRCIEAFGGTVEKFAGDAVMAAFGIPVAHEDDAERALRAALAIREEIGALGLQTRIGVEAGEVVTDDSRTSTFATGEAVNVAARLQETAEPNEIVVGPGAFRLAFGTIELESAGLRQLEFRPDPVPVWRAVGAGDRGRPPSILSAPLIGRDTELDLLGNTFERAARDRRAHLFTIYGDPGVGKSRLAREFAATLEGATVLFGRALPYGEAITYWPLAEMVKTAAGISDDDPVDAAHEKLLVCCEDEEVADLLGLAVGVLEALEGERSQQEIAWAGREWAEQLARAQPLLLVFEDIHWAEEPLLELIEHLSSWVREAPLMILCLARPELLDVHPGWGGGRLRATAIELEPLGREESEELARALLEDEPLPDELLDKTEGNPLFLEETIRMISEGGGDVLGIPDTLQALIAARVDRLSPVGKALIQRASVIGRIFWAGAIGHLSPEEDAEIADALEQLVLRDFILRETRSSISGEPAYRFKHVLIREVAYGGLSKEARAGYHARFAEWLEERAGEELLENRAHHLDHAAKLLAELDGATPTELAGKAAAALETAGRRALSREANQTARNALVRAVELEPTLGRRHKAAVAAWRLADYPAVSVEMEAVLEEARAAGDTSIQGRALNALADVAMVRDADLDRARVRAEEALSVLPAHDVPGRFDALMIRGAVSKWEGDLDGDRRYIEEALELARGADRKDLESNAAENLAAVHLTRLELDEAGAVVDLACRLAEESGSTEARARALASRGRLFLLRGEFEEAVEALQDARGLLEEVGAAWTLGRTLNMLGWTWWHLGDAVQAERSFRDSIRMLKPLEDRATLCESQRGLAQVLVVRGKLEEAERMALEARRTVGPQDQSSRATTRMALGIVRAAQGRDDEAEGLFREALAVIESTEFNSVRYEVFQALAQFLRERRRDGEAAAVEAQLEILGPSACGQPLVAASTPSMAASDASGV